MYEAHIKVTSPAPTLFVITAGQAPPNSGISFLSSRTPESYQSYRSQIKAIQLYIRPVGVYTWTSL